MSKRRDNTATVGPAEILARAVTDFTASTPAFILALLVIIVWGITGPLFGYSERAQDKASELKVPKKHFHVLAQMAKEDGDIHQSHSVDEAEKRHRAKTRRR